MAKKKKIVVKVSKIAQARGEVSKPVTAFQRVLNSTEKITIHFVCVLSQTARFIQSLSFQPKMRFLARAH